MNWWSRKVHSVISGPYRHTSRKCSHAMLSWNDVHFDYDPYPIGLARNILPGDLYSSLVRSFPPKELFVFKKHLGNKYSLSEINHREQYVEYVRQSKIWSEFHRWIKSD